DVPAVVIPVLPALLPVCLPPVRHPDDDHHEELVTDLVDDAIASLAQAVEITACELLAAWWARISCEMFDAFKDAGDICVGNAAKILCHRSFEDEPIACHVP